ncbi:hypothetical protein KL930_001261 [Ogataea haglerorum]|nr:hypothetical protein KL915_003171 [Ogataea haglerorum]KAG7743682.1 hypothetical protein KL932_001747 [Ogataea haglerorum]KAG7758297.1 hypothetical protein KL947_002676 [Ogataea haglerorum]KAG7780336.1 hypothetical protein KL922_000687 [Ogataea haglerorum]KAG7781765.1 hypothetical protein KL930_001261 [Ogataea haglerorum]
MQFLVRQGSFPRYGLKPVNAFLDLPVEILYEVFKQVPNELKATCRFFYVMYNDYYCQKLVDELGENIIFNISMYNFDELVDYIRSFDYWRGTLRHIVSNHYKLGDPEPDSEIRKTMSPKDIINCKYVKDSWKLIYGIYKNRRLFVEYDDYQIDEPHSYLTRSLLHVNKTYLVKYRKTIQLPADIYNLSCGIIVQNALGLGSMNFKVIRKSNQEELLSFFPATNINDLVPHGKFVLLDLGDFTVELTIEEKEKLTENKQIEVDIVMEETGLYLKSGFIICFIDINAYPAKLKRIDPLTKKVTISEKRSWIAWSIDNQDPTPENVINRLLKRLYKSINNLVALKPQESPYQRIGSFAELNEQTTKRQSNVVRKRRNSDFEEAIDIDTYNRKFYSRINEEGEPITRTFRYISMADRRLFENRAIAEEKFIAADEPLKWKLTTILEV